MAVFPSVVVVVVVVVVVIVVSSLARFKPVWVIVNPFCWLAVGSVPFLGGEGDATALEERGGAGVPGTGALDLARRSSCRRSWRASCSTAAFSVSLPLEETPSTVFAGYACGGGATLALIGSAEAEDTALYTPPLPPSRVAPGRRTPLCCGGRVFGRPVWPLTVKRGMLGTRFDRAAEARAAGLKAVEAAVVERRAAEPPPGIITDEAAPPAPPDREPPTRMGKDTEAFPVVENRGAAFLFLCETEEEEVAEALRILLLLRCAWYRQSVPAAVLIKDLQRSPV